jgi:hypothetical protein
LTVFIKKQGILDKFCRRVTPSEHGCLVFEKTESLAIS